MPETPWRLPLNAKRPSPDKTPRKERRAAERRDRFEVARDERRARAGTAGQGASSRLSTRNVMVGSTILGILIVAFVAANQLGGRVTGTLRDPAMAYPADLVDGRAIGPVGAPVTLRVYEDYQCPVCGRFSLEVEPVLVNDYVRPGLLRIEHVDIAILGRGGSEDESKLSATGAACADRQGRYWEYAHRVYANQDGENAGGFRRERLTAIAGAAGLDEAAFAACLDDPTAVEEVAAATTEALGRGINSTPTLYVNDRQVVGLRSARELGAMIEAAAAEATATP